MSMSKQSEARLMAEFEMMAKNPPAMASAGPIDGNLYKWQGQIFGPKKTPYEGGVFKLIMAFSEDFPIRPPSVYFTTHIYHVNISEATGWVCLDILGDKWNSTISVSQILLALLNLLGNPNGNDPVNSDMGKLMEKHNHQYNKKAREETLKYAIHRK